ncbi:nitrilase-related carbon-nitrogen hydrolase [Thermosphaera aggregans]|jgi:predicted amidohydrolase|uniref:nitrilase-related carbon-nitrogen hydrolase n=1 Tax=Thermosphaera aggregans TaxID=54254 RepID=UPI003C74B814
MGEEMELTIGIVQADFNGTPIENAEKGFKMVMEKHKEADIVVFPEYSMLNPLRFKSPHEVYAYSEHVQESYFVSRIKRLSELLSIDVIVNIIEKTDKPPRSRNTSVLVKNDGEVVPLYSKIHLFDALGYKESDYFLHGEAPSKFINARGFRLAVAICYDLRFPELFRFYALNGADGVFVQAGWLKGPLKEESLEMLASARAHENTMYIVLADQTGDYFVGRSGVFSPLGYRELDMGFREAYMEYTLSYDNIRLARERLPVVEQSRKKWMLQFNPSI